MKKTVATIALAAHDLNQQLVAAGKDPLVALHMNFESFSVCIDKTENWLPQTYIFDLDFLEYSENPMQEDSVVRCMNRINELAQKCDKDE